MSLKQKLVKNSIASGGSIAWSALLQLISVPILSSVWGIDRYGLWLMLTTIPAYFALSDLGFATAATSDMTMSHARKKYDDVLTTFQSVWILLLGISIVALVLVSPLLWLQVAGFSKPNWWPTESVAIFFMIAYSAGVLCSRVILAGFRATGNYASGTILYDAIQFLEGVAVLSVASIGGTFSECAIAYLFFRMANIAACYVFLRKKIPWLYLGYKKSRRDEFNRLLAPAIAAMAVPTALAINIQGMIIVAGTVISPAAAAMLGPVRTISRIAIQIVGIINRSTIPEFSAASAINDTAALLKLLRINFVSILAILLPGVAIFAFFGRDLMVLWSGGEIIPKQSFILLMAVGMCFQGMWFFSSNILMSINKNSKFAPILMMISISSVFLALLAGNFYGLNGVALSILLSELTAFLVITKDIKLNFFIKK